MADPTPSGSGGGADTGGGLVGDIPRGYRRLVKYVGPHPTTGRPVYATALCGSGSGSGSRRLLKDTGLTYSGRRVFASAECLSEVSAESNCYGWDGKFVTSPCVESRCPGTRLPTTMVARVELISGSCTCMTGAIPIRWLGDNGTGYTVWTATAADGVVEIPGRPGYFGIPTCSNYYSPEGHGTFYQNVELACGPFGWEVYLACLNPLYPFWAAGSAVATGVNLSWCFGPNVTPNRIPDFVNCSPFCASRVFHQSWPTGPYIGCPCFGTDESQQLIALVTVTEPWNVGLACPGDGSGSGAVSGSGRGCFGRSDRYSGLRSLMKYAGIDPATLRPVFVKACCPIAGSGAGQGFEGVSCFPGTVPATFVATVARTSAAGSCDPIDLDGQEITFTRSGAFEWTTAGALPNGVQYSGSVTCTDNFGTNFGWNGTIYFTDGSSEATNLTFTAGVSAPNVFTFAWLLISGVPTPACHYEMYASFGY